MNKHVTLHNGTVQPVVGCAARTMRDARRAPPDRGPPIWVDLRSVAWCAVRTMRHARRAPHVVGADHRACIRRRRAGAAATVGARKTQARPDGDRAGDPARRRRQQGLAHYPDHRRAGGRVLHRRGRGDLVRVTHDVPLWGLASGRIKALLDDGVNISAITLDEACPMETGKQYGIRVRQADGQSVYRNVITNAGETTTLTLVNPLALAAGPLPGDLVQFGEQSAAPGPDLSARITAVDHAPGIFTAATQAIPDFDPGITVPPGALTPVIDSIRSNEAVLV